MPQTKPAWQWKSMTIEEAKQISILSFGYLDLPHDIPKSLSKMKINNVSLQLLSTGHM
jgi:hypothetical protein